MYIRWIKSWSIQVTIRGAPNTILQSEKEITFESDSILINLSSVTMWKTIYKPTFKNISVATIWTTLVLEQPPKTMKYLVFCQHLPLINKIIVFFDRNNFKIEAIRTRTITGFNGMLAVCQKIKRFDFAIFGDPLLLNCKKVHWNWPFFKQKVLICVFSKAFIN